MSLLLRKINEIKNDNNISSKNKKQILKSYLIDFNLSEKQIKTIIAIENEIDKEILDLISNLKT